MAEIYEFENLKNYLDWLDCALFLRPRQQNRGYMGDSFNRSKEPTNSIEVLKKYKGQIKKKQQNTHMDRQ